jgi:hypothetical protein
VSTRYEIRPGGEGRQRRATHAEVLAAFKTTAKTRGLVPHLPAGKHGERWRATMDGLVVHGDVRRFDGDVFEIFWIDGDCNRDTLTSFAGQLAALLGRQAVIGDVDEDFWFVDKPTKTKTKGKRR